MNVDRLICLLMLCLSLASCTTSTEEPDWTWIQMGKTDKEIIIEWFGEPQRNLADPNGFGNRLPWEIWIYDDGMGLWFRDSVVEKLYLPKHLDPLLQNGYTIQQMLADLGLPEVVYEYYTESTEGIGIDGWSFIYPTRGDEFVISSMFVILPGKPNQPPPPALEIARHYQWSSSSTEEWLVANNEKIVRFGGTRIDDIDGYFGRMDPEISSHEPIVPPDQQTAP